MEISTVIRYAQRAHGEQEYGDMPYIVHLMLVARHFTDELHMTVALLHDIVEDTSVSITTIRRHFGDDVAEAVDALTHRPDEDYLSEYIVRLSGNELAKTVKIADLQENINSAENWYPGYAKLLPRYRKALAYLSAPTTAKEGGEE